MNAFEEILGSISDEQDRAALNVLGQKYPGIRENMLRQSDYSRKMNEVQRDLQEKAKWEDWATRNFDYELGTTKSEAEKVRQIEALSMEIAKLKAEPYSASNQREIESLEMQKQQFVSADVFKSFQAELDRRMSGYANAVASLASKTPRLSNQYWRDFNEDLDIDKMLDEANKAGITDIDKAYEMFTAPKRQEKQQKEWEAKIEAARAEEREKAKREFSMSHDAMPMDMDGGAPMGHMQDKIQGKQEQSAAYPEGVTLGQGSIARIAAQEYMQSKANQ